MRYLFFTSDIVNGLKLWTGDCAPQWNTEEWKWLPVRGQCRSVCNLHADQFPDITNDLQHGQCASVELRQPGFSH